MSVELLYPGPVCRATLPWSWRVRVELLYSVPVGLLYPGPGATVSVGLLYPGPGGLQCL